MREVFVIINVLLENRLLTLQCVRATDFQHVPRVVHDILSPPVNVHVVTFSLYSLVFLNEQENIDHSTAAASRTDNISWLAGQGSIQLRNWCSSFDRFCF